MDTSVVQETNQFSSGREEGRSPYTSPDSGLTNTSTDSSLSQRLGTPPNMYESVGQMCLPESGIPPMYDQQHQQQTNIGSMMSVMDNNCQPMPPDSQTSRNVILNQAESTLSVEVSSPASMPSNIGVMNDNYSSMAASAVTRVTGIYNGTEAHEIAAAVSTALAPDTNNLERVNQSPYQHTGQVMQGMPDKGTHVISTNTSRKPSARSSKKKKKKDPHEPQKPVSAYALFFRDTQASIKVSKPNASFGEVSKIVASMWDGLNQDTKNKYKKQTEAAKKEYLKLLADYKASLVSRGKNSRESHFNPGDDYGHYHVEDANRRNNSPRPNPGMNDSSMYNMQQHRLPSPMAKGKSPLFSPILTPEGSGGVGMQGQRNDVTGSSLPPHSPLQYGGGMHPHGNGDQQRRMNDPMRCSYSGQMNEMTGQSQHHYIHENPAVSLNTSSGMYAPPMSVQSMSGARQSHMMYSNNQQQQQQQHCQPQMMMTSMHNQQEQQSHHYPQSPYNEYTNLHSTNDMMGQQMSSMNPQNGSTLMMNGNDGSQQSDVTYMQMSVGHQQGGMGSNDIMLGRMPSPRVSDNRGYQHPNGSPLSSYQQGYTQMSYDGNTNGGSVDSYRLTSYSVDTDNGMLEVGKDQMHAIPVSQGQMSKPMNWGMPDQGRTIADLDSRKVNHERDIDRYSFTQTAYSSPGTDSSASLTCTSKSEDDKVEPTSSISRFFEGFSPSMVCNQSNTWIGGDHISTPNS